LLLCFACLLMMNIMFVVVCVLRQYDSVLRVVCMAIFLCVFVRG
jgi:hypothetical protein